MAIKAGLVFGIAFAALGMASAQSGSHLEPGILAALNRLRADPERYAAVLKQQRRYYDGNILKIPGQIELSTQEGVRPLDEAIFALRSLHASPGRVDLSTGLSRAAADHVLETGPRGLVGHNDFQKRIERHGVWSGRIGEDISYGARTPGEVISYMLIDDGVPDRGHRKSLLDPSWRYVGIACGFHGGYGTMCVLDFAVSYQNR